MSSSNTTSGIGGVNPSLFDRFFGAMEGVESTDEIEIDTNGNIQRIARQSFQEQGIGSEEKLQKMEKIVSILTDITSLLKGRKATGIDKENKEIAKKIYKSIEKVLKNEKKHIKEREKQELIENLGSLTARLVQSNLKSAAQSFKMGNDKASEALLACNQCMSTMQSDTAHMAADLIRYLQSGHTRLTIHSGDDILDFEPRILSLVPSAPPSEEAQQTYQTFQQIDKIVHAFLIELDIAEGKSDFDATDNAILLRWKQVFDAEKEYTSNDFRDVDMSNKLQTFFDELKDGRIMDADLQKCRNLAHLLMGFNQVNFVFPSQSIILATKNDKGDSTIMACQAFNRIDYQINLKGKTLEANIQYLTKFVDMPPDRRRRGEYSCQFQIDFDFTQKSKLYELDKWEGDLNVTVLVPTTGYGEEQENLKEIGDILQKLSLTGFKVSKGKCQKQIVLG